ncbi:hypothetical protein CS022_21875 [Veronia nyctiphanis]|uniref:Signal transduction histidine kinase internal region domain-containing protein n=1 Tax=Veronia nyctiphanis TaxID=1278244 RepID=A0A4Q0YM34_9GAMM|nr:histidine kinase [Veronia nyctiphanis]RXJ71054.1 hypothetical protein CS022_21875 [Veronia nyctiphanis]
MSIKKTIRDMLRISLKTTTAYKVCLVLGIAFLTMFNVTMIASIMPDIGTGLLVFRTFIEVLVFFALFHLLIRSYIKLSLLHDGMSWRIGMSLFVVSVCCGSAYVGFSYILNEISFFDDASIENFGYTMSSTDERREIGISSPSLVIVGIVNAVIQYWVIVAVYLVWQFYRQRHTMQKRLEKARLSQLTYQLNPHFLFNTLNSIRALIYEDKDSAADVVTELAELLRLHMTLDMNHSSSLEKDWQIARHFLTIEQVRLEDRLDLTIDLSPETLDQSVPSLCLLTLVENALKHGVIPNLSKGYLSIESSLLDNHHWQLRIVNSVGKPSQQPSNRIGLSNISERLTCCMVSKLISPRSGQMGGLLFQ